MCSSGRSPRRRMNHDADGQEPAAPTPATTSMGAAGERGGRRRGRHGGDDHGGPGPAGEGRGQPPVARQPSTESDVTKLLVAGQLRRAGPAGGRVAGGLAAVTTAPVRPPAARRRYRDGRPAGRSGNCPPAAARPPPWLLARPGPPSFAIGRMAALELVLEPLVLLAGVEAVGGQTEHGRPMVSRRARATTSRGAEGHAEQHRWQTLARRHHLSATRGTTVQR